jgi:hydroxypyruvate reductase
MSKHRKNIINLYHHALAAVEGTQAVRHYLPSLSLQKNKPISAIAIGKAAEAMLQGLFSDKTLTINNALLISKHGHISTASYQNPIIHCIEADHPVPNTASLQAGQALLNYIARLPATHTCIVLLSGGTSSLVEVLDSHWQLTELQELTEWMLAHAMPIDAINAVRSRVSCIKSGGLWHYFLSPTQKVICLLISDVPSNDERVIGSGLLFPSASTDIPATLPVKWRNKFSIPYTPHPQSYFFTSAIIANNQQAQQAAVNKAQQLGYQVSCDYTVLEGDAVMFAQQCVQTLAANRDALFIWGAETTVNLPVVAGQGGRNQHLALAAAIEMAKRGESKMMLLVAGTDGTDGTTKDAGGFVDHQTVLRGENNGLCATTSLKKADANSFLQASGDLVTTGVTGTNVMDLIIGYAVR